jgi:8-oxo-dGTP diphosphatase
MQPPGPSTGPSSGPDLPVVPCVGAIVHDLDGRLLLIRRGHAPHAGSWSLPGGRVEAGETPEQAVGRVQIKGDGVVYDVLDLACTVLRPGERPVAGDDATAVVFADAAALDRLACTPLLVETLRGWGVLPG